MEIARVVDLLEEREHGDAGVEQEDVDATPRTSDAFDHVSHGLVVGATAPAELASIRTSAPSLPFLVPGVGAQGGSIEPVLAAGPTAPGVPGRRPGGGLLVNVSRGISDAAIGPAGGDPGDRIAAAAREWASRLPVLP